SDSLTRGSRFTITITGNPNTAYYIWLTGTSTMSGEPYDQPPVISDTANVVKDAEGGPYTIGSYQYNNGGGKTIRDDVAPSTASMSNTNYYAQVTTDERGQIIVEFRTSVYTGIRSYSVKVENPAAPESENFRIAQTLYSRTARPMINTPAITRADPVNIVTTPPVLTTTLPVTTDTVPIETSPGVPATPQPTKKSPVTVSGMMLAAAAGACLAARVVRPRP
ncbi:MAG TPA: hypothetical protein VHN82_06430, partial [Methanoregula sp.]|nr:hypothetical protein [Methanoregula sp.]